MSNQLEKVKELIALREQARLGGGEKESNLSTRKASTQHANVSPCCLTKVVSRSLICSFSTVVLTSVLKNKIPG